MSKTKYKNQLNTENLTIIKVNNKSWYKGREIAVILEYKDTRSCLKRHVTNKNKKPYSEFNYVDKHTYK